MAKVCLMFYVLLPIGLHESPHPARALAQMLDALHETIRINKFGREINNDRPLYPESDRSRRSSRLLSDQFAATPALIQAVPRGGLVRTLLIQKCEMLRE